MSTVSHCQRFTQRYNIKSIVHKSWSIKSWNNKRVTLRKHWTNSITSSVTSLPFRIKRRQFPVRLYFAITMRRAQGESINHPQPLFLHGQFYVALSRAGLPRRTKVMLIDVTNTQGTNENIYGKFLLKCWIHWY